MSDDVKAAADRRRTSPHVDGFLVGDDPNTPALKQRVEDAGTLADAYLAANPADGDEPVSKSWLIALGGDTTGGLSMPCWRLGGAANFLAVSEREAFLDLASGDVIPLPHIRTRGQLRQLCRALGVPLTEAT